jgi:ABC-type nitrate/sulfonate/bicarbonate transport system substrate-binding protein
MINLKIGGVPEHFNYPWYSALKNKEFTQQGINLRWKDFPGGTGDMCQALRSGKTDIAIILTEGIIKDIIDGNPSKILQTYVNTPLIWGIHVAENSTFQSIDDLEGKRIAISRYGSGSHLMAIVNAYNQGWNLESLHFVVVKNLEGGINALQNDEADYFMWEHFTTKPYVTQGIFRRVSDCPTPWPCFVIAVRDEILEKHPVEIAKVLEIINQTNAGFKSIKNIDQVLSKRYHQELEDIQKWLSITEWNHGEAASEEFISEVQNKLLHFNVIKQKKNSREFIKNMYI